MSDGNQMTRRDWFRLTERRADTPKPAAAHAMGKHGHALQPIEHPVNHDGMDLSQLPPMREALLTSEEVEALFTDIESLATDILLMQRTAGKARATASRASTAEQLQSAKDAILNGSVARLQIRYRWNNADWIDTLQSQGNGYRLIRIQHAAR